MGSCLFGNGGNGVESCVVELIGGNVKREGEPSLFADASCCLLL